MYSIKHIKKLCAHAKERKFSFPAGFEEKTFSFLQQHYNGIGAEWMPKFVRKIVTFLLSRLEAAALLHDIEYLSENKKFWLFTKANFRLLVNCTKDHCFFPGVAAALLCQIFGWSAWKDGKETMAYFYYYKEDPK
jgi:hypothetical protein